MVDGKSEQPHSFVRYLLTTPKYPHSHLSMLRLISHLHRTGYSQKLRTAYLLHRKQTIMHQRRVCNLNVDPPTISVEAGAQDFDRSLFHKRIRVVAARIPASSTGEALKADSLKRCSPKMSLEICADDLWYIDLC